jgi:hypothetical protein
LFDTKGSVVFAPGTTSTTHDDREVLALCLLLNTEVAQFIFDLSGGASDEGKARDYSQGMVSALPIPKDIVHALGEVLPSARKIVAEIIQLASSDPTSIYFTGLPKRVAPEASGPITPIVAYAHGLQQRLNDVLRRTSNLYAGAVGIGPEAEAAISDAITKTHRKSVHDGLNITDEVVSARLRQSLLIEAIAGKPNLEHLARATECEKDLLHELPWGVLGRLSGASGILVDDPGHPADIELAVARSMELNCLSLEALAIEDLRTWLKTKAFEEHIAMFSRSKRVAPVIWCLSTVSRSYSVWLYIHAFSRDTLFRVQNDYAVPKLAHEERRLYSLISELRDGVTAAQRKELAAQEAVVEELRTLVEEVKRVAPLWNPNLDDGVIINFAPLWRLVPQNKSWQIELKSTWDALCEGQYDWAHLAMHLWPERVVPNCAKERSLAIAHSLEDVFWAEGTDGKWTARKTPTRSVDELVRERTSLAVKSALKSLLEAPVVIGNSGGGRGGRRGSAAATARGQV